MMTRAPPTAKAKTSAKMLLRECGRDSGYENAECLGRYTRFCAQSVACNVPVGKSVDTPQLQEQHLEPRQCRQERTS